MTDASSLYHPIILEHNRAPHNYVLPESYSEEIEAYNPLCGDQFRIYIIHRNEVVERLAFQGYGCAVSTAAISILTDIIPDRTWSEAHNILDEYLRFLRGEGSVQDQNLRIFEIARKFPGRLQCATLGANALHQFFKD